MRALLSIALLVGLYAPCCYAQAAAGTSPETGTVTFYTLKNTVKSEAASTLPRSNQPFTGWLFDGSKSVAHFRAGRFMTLHVSAGAHTFTVPWQRKNPGKEPHIINVESGGQSCVRLYAKMTNFEVAPFAHLDSRMEEVPCEQAQREGANLKPLEIEHINPVVRPQLDATASFPAGAQAQH